MNFIQMKETYMGSQHYCYQQCI